MKKSSIILIAFVFIIVGVGLAFANNYNATNTTPQDSPCFDNHATRGSNVALTITNQGIIGSEQNPSTLDPESGLPAPSCRFPANSGLEYLFMGSIWVGAIVDGDTLVSCGSDGWWDSHELFPKPCPEGEMEVTSNVADREIIGVCYDTSSFADDDPIDGPHTPIGLKITTHSFSWNYPPYSDFVILRFTIENITANPINDIWTGLYYDGDVADTSRLDSGGAQDDICGYTESDGREIAWIADNDGDPSSGEWDDRSVRSVCGIEILSPPESGLQTSFN